MDNRITGRVSPVLTEPAARGFGVFMGGPVGRYALVGRQRWWTPRRVIILLGAIYLALGYLMKARCLIGARGSNGEVGTDWSGDAHFVAACYNDIVPLFSGRGMDEGGFPYAYSWLDNGQLRYMEYPVLGGLFQGFNGWLTRLTYPLIDWIPGHLVAPGALYFTWTALGMAIMWMLVLLMVEKLLANRVWDAVLVAASPVVIMHAFTNWDIPAIFLAVAALHQAARGRLAWSGVLIGLGTAFKLWPLFLLGAYFVLAARSGRWASFAAMAGGAIASWAAVNLPVWYFYPEAWGEFFRMNSERGWEWTTIYAIVSREFGWTGFPNDTDHSALGLLTFGLFAGSCLAIALVGWRARRTPRVAELVFLIVAAFLLFNKVWSPQYSIWLVVPAVLAAPYWRLLLSWMTMEFMVWPVLCWHMLGEDKNGIPGWFLDIVLVLRDGLIIALVVLVVMQIRGSVPDKVLRDNGRDPLLPRQFDPARITETDVEIAAATTDGEWGAAAPGVDHPKQLKEASASGPGVGHYGA